MENLIIYSFSSTFIQIKKEKNLRLLMLKYLQIEFAFEIILMNLDESQGTIKNLYRLINCSPPRKSLVKGERFIRILKGNHS